MSSKPNDIKSENVCSQPAFCYGCFSVDRPLSQIGDLADVFFSILDNRYLSSNILQVQICWECKAVIKKIKVFKCKVNSVQNFLNCYFSNNLGETLPTPLTSLAVSGIDQNPIIIYHEDKLNLFINENLTIKRIQKVELEVPTKTEITTDFKFEIPVTLKEEVNDDLNYDWNNEDISLDDIKVEIKPEKEKKHNKYKVNKVTPKFKIINNSVKREKGVLQYKKIKIKETEISRWLEKDKMNESFLKWPFRCDKCIWGSSYEGGLTKHNTIWHSEDNGSFKCEFCSCVLGTKIAIVSHLRYHFYIHQCEFCGYQCYTKNNMLGHIMKYHEKIVKCLRCGMSYHNTKLFYRHHKEIHAIFICDHCGKKCFSRKMIKSHLFNKHGDTDCKICKRPFKTRHGLLNHNQIKHPAVCNPELCYCVECDKQFENIVNFRRHLQYSKAHQGDSGFMGRKDQKVPCPECDKVYARKTYMMNHYRHVHLKQSKYYCQICDRYFLNLTRYKDHHRYKHEGYVPEKNKLCTMCGRGFSTNRILEKHIRTHTGERPFECTYCDAKFTQKESQQSHIKHIHLKVKRQPQPASHLGKLFEYK